MRLGIWERILTCLLPKRGFVSDLEDSYRGSRGSIGLGKDRRSRGFSERKFRNSISKRWLRIDLEIEDEDLQGMLEIGGTLAVADIR